MVCKLLFWQPKAFLHLECKVWRNPLSLFRGAEYNRFYGTTNKEPLTYYDMNLSAQDHQTFFTSEADAGKVEYESRCTSSTFYLNQFQPNLNIYWIQMCFVWQQTVMQTAWRERDPQARIKAAHEALDKNAECAPAYILLAEEEATTIAESEKIFRQALKVAETAYRKSQQYQHQSQVQEAVHRRDTNVLIYIRRRLAMCQRKLGKLREASKMMRDLIKEFPMMNVFNIHENLIETLLEMQAYADVQAVLAKYDG